MQGSAKDEEGFDLVHLCSIFASDPFVMAFAKLIESGTSYISWHGYPMPDDAHPPVIGDQSLLGINWLSDILL